MIEKWWLSRARRSVNWMVMLSLLLGFCVSVQVTVAASPAQAANASDWDPGYIIDDAVFYDSTSFTSSEVQSFLTGKGGTCASGYVCLKSYSAATPSMNADPYCKAYAGGGNQTAAQIIDGVSRACGISQRVLLVMLEKEQGLVSSTAPSARSYNAAMGMSCPDTAPCDPAYSGFFYQVYYGARQFQVYRQNPASFGYRAERWNTILYSPNASCGSRQVYIANQATASLYIYTPYTPNQAALNNLYGSGDACSAYGNRNFWRLFSDWFGDPHRFVVNSGFVAYWEANGGASGKIGPPAGYAVYVAENGQGWYQNFRGGTLYGSYLGGTVFVPANSILGSYNAWGGARGSFGFPNGEISCTADNRCAQSFVNAVFSSTSSYGAHPSWGGLRTYWDQSGGLNGTLGSALNDIASFQTSSGQGWVQNFQKGVVAAGPPGTFTMPSRVPNLWASLGGANGTLGWPSSSYTCNGSSCAQNFQSGVITESPAGGMRSIWGGFDAVWRASGGVGGTLGAATSDIAYVSSSPYGAGYFQPYERGTVTESGVGQFAMSATFDDVWFATGAHSGWLGWPTEAQSCGGSGCQQRFQGGIIVAGTSGPARAIVGGFSTWWQAAGGLGGPGVPLDDIRYSSTNGGGWAQTFAAGTAAQSRSSNVAFVGGSIGQLWASAGLESSWFGWPQSAEACAGGECGQAFQNAVITNSPTAGIHASVGGLGALWSSTGGIAKYGAATTDTRYSEANGGGWLQSFKAGLISQTRSGQPLFTPSGPILRTWEYYGAERTWMGFPTGPQTCNANTCSQDFQGGVATQNEAGEIRFTAR